MLLVKQCSVLVCLQAYTVREIRIAVMLFKLRIFDPQVNISFHCRLPCINSTVIECRVNKVFLDRQRRRCPVDILTVGFMRYQVVAALFCTVHVHPAVASLPAEILNAVCVIVRSDRDSRSSLSVVCIGNADIETAAVIRIVIQRVYSKIETVMTQYIEIIDHDLCIIFFIRIDRYIFKLQQLSSFVYQQLNAVRIIGIRVAVNIFHK